MVVHRATGRPVDGVGLTLCLSGILAAYSLDRILDGSNGLLTRWLRRALYIGAGAGLVTGSVMLTLMPLRTGMLVPVLGVLVLAYPRLKSLPLLKTVLVSGAWTWSLIALPFHDGSWLGWRAWMAPVAIPLTFVIASGCLLCDLKDAQADRDASVPSLPVVMGVPGTIAVAVFLATISGAVSLAEHRIGLLVGGLGLGLAAMRPKLLARDVVGPLLVDVILTIPGLLIALHIV
jgi:4-hydroxybenzoate polyprenyltransferase